MDNLFHTDLTFITNEEGQSLKDRFEQLIRDSRYFDCLVAYFYISGFHALYKVLENTERIRILIGIGISRDTYNLLTEAREPSVLSHYETKDLASEIVEKELAESEDKLEIEEGAKKFVEWIRSGKLEIRAYPSRNIHAKVYIMTFEEGDRDVGRVITGSSNFTQSGLIDNLEFNVELKNRADYEFAKQKFNELWNDAVEVSERFVQTINEKTWLNENITPYELYLKFLYEYFKDELSRVDEIHKKYLPDNYKELEYQQQAILNAKKILEEYGGVFLSDVVGLGKTYMGAMLAGELDGRTMVIAPPSLLNRANPGSWHNVFADFRIHAEFISIGKLDDAKREMEFREYKNIIIDESHRFRNESTISYEEISEICRGKRIILISATPYNNSPADILSQIKLFQNPRKSTIPGISDLEGFFNRLQTKQEKIDRDKNYKKYLEVTRENAKEIRNKVLKYIMIRRTRTEIEKYFKDDLNKNKIKFPEIKDPQPFYYQFNTEEDRVFTETIEWLTKKFTYARYTPLLYFKNRNISQFELQSQKNMGGFMKVLLVKRLESSFYAFKKSIERFISSYKMFIDAYKSGKIYISKKYSNKIFELLEEGDDEKIQQLIEEGKAEEYDSSDFMPELESSLIHDLELLEQIKSKWDGMKRDPKAETLIESLRNHPHLRDKKVILFTESRETAEYLVNLINQEIGNTALLFHGQSEQYVRDRVIENFDARARNQKNDFRVLVATDVLSEGVNLHRSNIVINYDIPWNPTKLMQRVGRINRIDTQFDEILTFNFFPTSQAESEIELTHIARSKIEAFLTLLGGDASILTEGEPVESHELFDKLLSKRTIMGDEEEESELKYLRIIEDVRNSNPKLFERIKSLPKKARSAKKFHESFQEVSSSPFLITFFRKGKLMKFFMSDTDKNTMELDFMTSAKIFESIADEPKEPIPSTEYYELLDKNKTTFFNATIEEFLPQKTHRGGKNEYKLLKDLKMTLKNSQQLTDNQEEYLSKFMEKLEQGAIPETVVKDTLGELKKLGNDIQNPLKVLSVLQNNVSPNFLKSHYVETSPSEGKTEVILSLFVNKPQ